MNYEILKDVCFLATKTNGSKTYLKSFLDRNLLPEKVLYVDLDYIEKPKLSQIIKGKIKTIIFGNQVAQSTKVRLEEVAKQKMELAKSREKAENYYLPIIDSELKGDINCNVDLKESMLDLMESWGVNYEVIKSRSINGTVLEEFLVKKVKQEYVIFTGGGILRKNMFSTGKKFIHVHPGVVPHVRGADCLLWSVLVRNKIGMSVFFMNEGIDTGEIIHTKEYPIPRIFRDNNKYPDPFLPSVLINYLDPLYRAEALMSAFKISKNPAHWKVTKQQQNEGEYYHFMHPDLAIKTTQKFFSNE